MKDAWEIASRCYAFSRTCFKVAQLDKGGNSIPEHSGLTVMKTSCKILIGYLGVGKERHLRRGKEGFWHVNVSSGYALLQYM